MFQLGEMFVKFVGKDGGLARTVKLAEGMGKNVTKVFQTAMKEGGKIGVQVAKGFERIGIASSKAAVQVSRSFAQMGTAASRAAGRIAPAFLRSFDRLAASASRVGAAGIKGLSQMGTAGIKQIGPLSKLAGQAGSGLTSLAGSIASMATGSVASFSMVGAAASAMWASLTGGLTVLVGLMAGIGALIGTTTVLASNMQEADAKFDVVFGKSAPIARKRIEELSEAMGRSEGDLRSMAGSVQDLLVPIGFARDKAAEMSVSIAQLAVDMASFNNVSDSQAIEDIHAALAGSHETMKKYGIALNETTMKTEMARLGYRGAAEDASEQMKALARLNIIIRSTGDAHGDAVRTGGNFANQMKRIMGLVMDIGRTIGQIFLPAAEVFAQFFSANLQNIKDNTDFVAAWGQTLKEWAETAVLWIGRLITLIMNWQEISKTAFGVVNAAANAMLDGVVITLDNVEIFIGNMFNNLLEFFPNLVTAIARSHGSLWGFLRKGWAEIWDFIKSGGTDAIDIDFNTMLKNFAKEFEGPQFKPLNTGELVNNWQKLIGVIDTKIAETERQAKKNLPDLKTFTAAEAGLKPQNKVYKFELVSAGDLFKKNLEAAFEDKKDEEKLRLAQAGVELQKQTLDATKEVAKAVKEKPVAPPVVGA